MSGQNWRTEIDAVDYFLHQNKQLEVADRRPVVRKASDLVGPGIGANTVRITDYSDLLATFNGYYSSETGADNAPNSVEDFVGFVVSDAAFGGTQVFTGITSGTEYRRRFTRSPVDPEALSWSDWTGNSRVVETAQGYNEEPTTVLSGVAAQLFSPHLTTIGDAGVYERPATGAGINLLKQGVYTGSIQVGDQAGTTVANVAVWRPDGTTTRVISYGAIDLGRTLHVPFTVIALDGEQGFSVAVGHAAGEPRNIWWRFSCTRVGDAV